MNTIPGGKVIPSYLKGFSKAQLSVILGKDPVKQVIAAAGSGKTRTVIGIVEHSLRAGGLDAESILMLSFSRKAVAEIRERLPLEFRHQVEVSTFHSFCFRHLSALHPRFRKVPLSILTEDIKEKILHGILRKYGDTIGGIPFDLLLREEGLFRERFPNLRKGMMRTLRRYKKRNSLLEYEELIGLMLKSLRQHASFVEPLRTRYSLIIVDEFQDTDPGQMEFLKLMMPPSLVVVGDDWQAIYAFRGATVRPFLEFRKSFPGAVVYRLSENYRSVRSVVQLGNRVIRHSSRQLRKRVRSVRGSGCGFPAISLQVDTGDEEKIVRIIKCFKDYRILARSNRRVERWTEAGAERETAMTIHRSKGLEFSVVFLDLLGGWSGGGEGGNRREKREREDEEIRIAYVGLSRAKDLIVVLRRPFYGERSREGFIFERLFSGGVRSVTPSVLEEYARRLQ